MIVIKALLSDHFVRFKFVNKHLNLIAKNISDEKLKDIKHDLYEQMMSRKMDKSTRQGLYNFLTYYVGFENQGTLTIFESEIENKLGRSSIMGTQEYLLDKAESKALLKVLRRGV